MSVPRFADIEIVTMPDEIEVKLTAKPVMTKLGDVVVVVDRSVEPIWIPVPDSQLGMTGRSRLLTD